MTSLRGRVALVTGAARGIGQAIAEELARCGATVVLNDLETSAELAGATESIRSKGHDAGWCAVDVSKPPDVDRMVADIVLRWGRIDVLVNNAGICPFADFLDVTEETWDQVCAVNLKGTFFCSQAVARHLVATRSPGRIISISSISAIVGGSLQTHYTPTKAGQRSLMRSLAIVLGPHGITCNSVLPGTIETPLNEEFLAAPETRAHYAQRIPVGRLGIPSDVAGAVAFLASDSARYVNGAEIVVDGGALVNLA